MDPSGEEDNRTKNVESKIKFGKIKVKGKYPKVSVCTPTYNRRPFIPYAIKNFTRQTYPMDKMEWVVVDDGTDCIEDCLKDVPNVKYFRVEEKMPIGKKRNYMHSKCTGDIIVYMDDDDFYPKERVMHAVDGLREPKIMCTGSSNMFMHYNHINTIYELGPYGPKHSTAGTFAFKKHLLNFSSYNEEAEYAEEKGFLHNYTVPFSQLNPMKTILVFSHEYNTFDKKRLLQQRESKYLKRSDKKIEEFIEDPELIEFYTVKSKVQMDEYHRKHPKIMVKDKGPG